MVIVQESYKLFLLQSLVKEREKVVIDSLIDMGPQKAGDLDRECVHSLYKYVHTSI